MSESLPTVEKVLRRGWFADWDDEATTEYGWQPCLETGVGHIPCFEVWFKTKAACEAWIAENVVGVGWFPDDPTEISVLPPEGGRDAGGADPCAVCQHRRDSHTMARYRCNVLPCHCVEYRVTSPVRWDDEDDANTVVRRVAIARDDDTRASFRPKGDATVARETVRRLTSNRTHVADVEHTAVDVIFGKTYDTPDPSVRSLCGVLCRTSETVVMREGTEIRCPACSYLYSNKESR